MQNLFYGRQVYVHWVCGSLSVFKIRSETCRTEAQFCQNLYIFIYDKEGKLAGPTQILPVNVRGPALILKTGLWWIHMVLLTPKHVEIQCFGLKFSTANQWEVTKSIFFFFFHHYCRYLNQIRSAHRYNTVIQCISWPSFKRNNAGEPL